MASPNGYFDCAASTNISRNWFRARITHDINNPPWDTSNAGSYEFEINIGTAALGPFTPAPVTDIVNECAPEPDNLMSPGGIADTLFGVGGPAELLADTDYWLEIVLRDPNDVEVDRFVCGPTHTEPYPTMICLAPDVTQTTGEVGLAMTNGTLNLAEPCNEDSIVWELATVSGGPYTPAPSEPVEDFTPSHTFTGLTPGTQYFARARLTEQAQTGGEYLVTPECPFTTATAPAPGGQSMFQPQPCNTSGAGEAGADVEQTLLCDVLPDGQIAGTALAVYEYDSDGNPAGPPTFVDPATGDPYVAQGILQPCPGEVGCAPPVQFCFTSTTSGPVEHPGRTYDITLPINPGFAVDSLQIDATNYPANITWAVTDPDGEQFRPALQSFLDARFPDQTVTVTNPNAGTPVCGLAQPMTIHIECARIDAPAPNLVELIYNGGRDLVVNPAYLTTPPTNLNGPQFVYLRRQDAGGTLNCTSVANQGWETNDLGDGARDFELWGTGPGGLQTLEGATPTPRGTPIQEITADINDTGAGPTIWQTFTVPAAGVFKAVMVHGARDNGETHRITLSTGDTNDNQVGDLINNVTNPPQVTNVGGNQPGPWTTFSQDIALGAGTYTFAISTTNPVGANRGGLFTDMRVYVDAPDQHAAAVTDDETCTVTTEETVTTTTCELWQPRCSNGEITHWVNVADGQELTNAAFWGQAPAPTCCLPEGGDGDGGSVSAGNLIHNYEVCGIVGGIAQTLQRVVITDQSGGVVGQTFVGADGGPVTPSSYTVGACDTGSPVVGEFILCDDNGPFVRKLIQSPQGLVTAVVNVTLAGVPYVPVGTVQQCGDCPLVLGNVCVTSTDFPGVTLPASAVMGCDGTVEYLNPSTGQPWPNAGPPVICSPPNQTWEEILCDQGNDNQPFRRIYNVTALGSVVFYDETLDAADYLVVGPAVVCGAGGLVLGERCYNIPEDGPQFTGGLGTAGASNVTGNPFHAEYVNWQGSGVDVTVDSTGPGGHINATHTQWNPAGSQPVTITFSEPVALNSITVGELDNQNQEFIETFTPPWTGLTGTLYQFNAPDVVASSVANGNPDGDIQFGGVQTNNLSFSVRGPGLGQWLQGLNFNTLVAGGQGRAAVVRCQGCDEGSDLVYIDLATGLPLDPDTTAWVECTQTVTVSNQPEPAEFADTEVLQLCDSTGDVPFLRRLTFDATGALTGTVDTDYDGAPYVVVGDAIDCAAGTTRDVEQAVLCDNNGPFLRVYQYSDDTGTPAGPPSDFTLAGAPYVPVGTVINCGAASTARDEELLVLCDSTPTRFLRRYNYDVATGNLIGIVNTTLDGSTPFAPVGAVGICTTAIASDFDFLSTVLCDSNGTQFIQRLTFNSATGAVTATTNTTLTGGAFVPVGAVSLCSNCCPTVIGQGCTNVGSGFYTAIRSTTGTISLIDSVTGAAVAAANIIPCPSDNTTRTLTAQARLVGDADAPWTPGADVVGTLTSVTMTVLSGTATLTDQNGTVLAGLPAGFTASWAVEDDNTLTGPTSIDAIGGSTVVHWTQR